MYVDRNEVRRLVAGASDGGWDCVGVCYGVPDLGEQVIDEVPRVLGQTSEIPGSHAQEGAFPVGVAAVVFGVILGGFVLSFFVKRSPTGRWRLER